MFRLYRRLKTKILWWDDYWAFFSLVMDFAYFPTIWMRQEVGGEYKYFKSFFFFNRSLPPGGEDADTTERRRRIALYWMTAVFPPFIVWYVN